MKVERKRVFISDLPISATQDDIQKIFSEYGKVDSIEIKERKELGPKNKSLFFAYINIDIDDKTMQKCFKDFASETWHGEYVQLQLARESFLQRLKREREESGQPDVSGKEHVPIIPIAEGKSNTVNGFTENNVKRSGIENRVKERKSIKEPKKIKEKSSSSSASSSSENESAPEADKEQKKQDVADIIIKNNKGKTLNKKGLRIAPTGNEPILKIDTGKKKNEVNTSEANLKRLESLKNMKRGYQTQKSLIKAALSNVDNVKNNKIVFDDEETEPPPKKKNLGIGNSKERNKSLFNEEESEDEFEGNFEVKEHFQGMKGQKLLQLQSKFKNDKRFELNETFLEDENDEQKEDQLENEETSFEAEKRKEYEILEQVIGKKLTPKFLKKQASNKQERSKAMLRFDPSRPEHSEFEIPAEKPEKKEKKKKKKERDVNVLAEKKREEPEQPEVSKEVFYKVTDDIKSKLHEKEEFSLLNMFGEAAESKEEESIAGPSMKFNKTVANLDKNPFKYDSTDDEDDIPHTGDAERTTMQKTEQMNTNTGRGQLWFEPFFFKEDDYRLQEGFDFLEKMKSEQKEFVQVRRDLKGIVRAKVRNNERKNKMFKKKLGGSKNRKKKHIRIKKALNR